MLIFEILLKKPVASILNILSNSKQSDKMFNSVIRITCFV